METLGKLSEQELAASGDEAARVRLGYDEDMLSPRNGFVTICRHRVGVSSAS